MWISRDPGRMLVRDNARRRWQNGECLIHANPLLCGLRAWQQRDPRGKVPPPSADCVTDPFWKRGGIARVPSINASPSITAASIPCPQCGQATRIKLVEPHPVLEMERRTFECQECGLKRTYALRLN
jgi:hypothetical protein